MGEFTVAEWNEQFSRQAGWTEATRSHLYRRANLRQAGRVLDVGCGTGVITRELARRTRGEVIGLDIDPERLAFARASFVSPDGQAAGRAEGIPSFELGDACDLPYPNHHFDVVACHFVLLWIPDPLCAVREMARVTRRQGRVLICAEPDYGGRLDHPDLPIREWQVEGLRRQGADPLIGRRVHALLVEAGLRADVSILPSLWDAEAARKQFEAEWALLQRDVGDAVDEAVFAGAKAEARAAIDAGTRLVYMPIFYALARRA